MLILQPAFLFGVSQEGPFRSLFDVMMGFLALFGALCFACNMAIVHEMAGRVSTTVNQTYSYLSQLGFSALMCNFVTPEVNLPHITICSLMLLLFLSRSIRPLVSFRSKKLFFL